MKTRFRTATIVMAIGLLSISGGLPAVIYQIDDFERLPTGAIVFFLLFSTLFIAGVVAIMWLTSKIEFDPSKRTVQFTYPFRFQTYKYSFNDLLGFRYKYLYGRVAYKALIFRTKGDGRTFSISDFETVNLRDIERFAISNFDLRADKSFKKLTEKAKDQEIERSREFDFIQAKKIRFHLVLAAGALTFIMGSLVYRIPKEQGTTALTIGVVVTVMFTIIIFTVRRIIKIHERIKNGAQ